MEAVAEYLWTNPDVVQDSGTMRSKLKMAGREFGVLGNTCVETFYNSDAESPDIRVIPIEDVVFNPTKSLKRSERYYIRQYVDMEYLEDLEEIKEDGKVVKGLFKNLDKLKESLQEASVIPNDPTPNWVNRYGSNQYDRPVGKILLISVWDDDKLCQIANWNYIIREVEDPMQIEDDPLDFAMDIEVPKIPYAFSILDFINGLTTAKDLILNQVVDYGAKALNPPIFVDPSVSPLNRQTLRNAWKTGGIVLVNPQQAGHLPMSPLPPVGFDLMNYIQQRSESVTGIGAYLGGVPNQASDKTKGTKGGVEALISQAASPVQDRQQNIEESIIEPVINKMLKMTGAMMGQNEEKWIFVSGQEKKWVKVTSGLLTGKIKLPDLVTAGLISEEDAARATTMIEDADENPKTKVLFDVEWIVRVETGSMAEIDSAKDIDNLNNWVGFNAQFGVPMDLVKISKELALRSGIKEPDQYLAITPGGQPQQGGQQPNQPAQPGQPGQPPIVNQAPFNPEKPQSGHGGANPQQQAQQHQQQMQMQQAQAQAQLQAQQQAQQAQMAQRDQQHQQNLQLKAADIQSRVQVEQMKQQGQMATAQAQGNNEPNFMAPATKLVESMNYKDVPVEAQNVLLRMAHLPQTAKEQPQMTPQAIGKPKKVAGATNQV